MATIEGTIAEIKQASTKTGKPYEKWRFEGPNNLIMNFNVFASEVIGKQKEGDFGTAYYTDNKVGDRIYYNVTAFYLKDEPQPNVVEMTAKEFVEKGISNLKKEGLIKEKDVDPFGKSRQESIQRQVALKGAVEFVSRMTDEERKDMATSKELNIIQIILQIGEIFDNWLKQK